jgi:hypothetical protein
MSNTNGTTEARIEDGKKATLKSIETDLKNDCWSALYYATEAQIQTLIDQERICEDFASRHQDYQEEMRCEVASAMAEFA